MGKDIYGVSIISRVLMKFEITVSGISKLQKTMPRNFELPRSVGIKVSGRLKIIIKYTIPLSGIDHNSNGFFFELRAMLIFSR